VTRRSAAGTCGRALGWLRRLALAVASAVVLIAVAPAVASAAITVTHVTLTSAGLSSIAAPGGSVATDSHVTVTTTGLDRTRAVAYSDVASMSGATCVDVSGNSPYALDVTLPVMAGIHSLYFQATTATGCGGTRSAVFRLSDAVRVTNPAPNPGLSAGCGLDVMLVLDESYSIRSPTDYTNKVRDAAKAFLRALSGTGSSVAITVFSRTSRLAPFGYTLVNQTTINDVFTPYIDNAPGSGGYNPSPSTAATNWQAGFNTVRQANESRRAQLVVFVTDGDPNTYTTDSGGTTTGKDGNVDAMTRAAAAADQVKLQGSHAFVIGVGRDVENALVAARLAAISGPNKYPSFPDFSRADYTVVQEFSELEASLRQIAVSLCESSLVVTKLVAAADGEGYTESPGWRFTTTVSAPGGHEWREPPAGTAPSASATTNTDGVARFEWRTNGADADSAVSVAETQMPGYRFVQAQCQTITPTGAGPIETDTTGIPSATLKPHEFRTCQVYNVGPSAHLTVVKSLIPSTDPGRFDLLVDGVPRIEQVGDGGSTGQLTVGVGTHTVSEQVTAAEADSSTPITLDQYSIGTSCLDQTTGAVVASGTGPAPVSVTLTSPSQNVVCTITNTRTSEPPPPITPPEPPVVPTPPCGDYESPTPECGEIVPSVPQARLTIHKQMPAKAAVGDLVPVTITIQNVGDDTAASVVLRDTPPGGGRIVRIAGFHGRHAKDGTVIWTLGDLAPGAKRTVHATMLITQTGTLRNTAIAGAGNAGSVVANAHVRVAAAVSPAVTG
jgi:uncharacterized repeat protein (TIGR01451 family)